MIMRETKWLRIIPGDPDPDRYQFAAPEDPHHIDAHLIPHLAEFPRHQGLPPISPDHAMTWTWEDNPGEVIGTIYRGTDPGTPLTKADFGITTCVVTPPAGPPYNFPTLRRITNSPNDKARIEFFAIKLQLSTGEEIVTQPQTIYSIGDYQAGE